MVYVQLGQETSLHLKPLHVTFVFVACAWHVPGVEGSWKMLRWPVALVPSDLRSHGLGAKRPTSTADVDRPSLRRAHSPPRPSGNGRSAGTCCFKYKPRPVLHVQYPFHMYIHGPGTTGVGRYRSAPRCVGWAAATVRYYKYRAVGEYS